jgi:hypothetical protein
VPLDPSLDPVFDAAGQIYNVDPTHLKAMALAESAGDPQAVSPKGAQGLMQLMPDTAKAMGVINPLDPVDSIFGGAQYYSQALDKYGNPNQALQAYHGGIGNEKEWGAATQAYPGLVANAYRQLQGGASPQTAQNTGAPPNGVAALAASSGAPPGMTLNPAAVQSAQQRAQSAAAVQEKPAQWIEDLSRMMPGIGVLSPEYEGQKAAATKAGSNLQNMTPGPNGPVISPMQGSVESDAQKAGAVARAQNEEKIEITRDGGIYKGGVYIGHAPKMTDVVDAQGNKYPAFTPPIGQVAPGVAPPETPAGAPPGAVMSSPSELGPGPHEALSKGEELSSETYNEARKSFLGNQSATQNLANYLEAASKVGTGRGTNFSGNAAAWLKSSGVDPDKLSLADPAQVQIMQKAANQMLAAAVRSISARPAFADFGVLEKGLPDPEKQPEAQKQIAASLLGRMTWENQLFKDWDADRRKTGSPSSFDMPSWVEAHPTQAFQSSALEQMPNIPQRGIIGKPEAPAPQQPTRRSRFNPDTGKIEPMQ